MNANLALFMSVVVKKAGGTKVWTMSREHARVFFLVRFLLVRSQKYRQTMSRVNACSFVCVDYVASFWCFRYAQNYGHCRVNGVRICALLVQKYRQCHA